MSAKTPFLIEEPRASQQPQLIQQGTAYLVRFTVGEQNPRTIAVSSQWLSAMKTYQEAYGGPFYGEQAACEVDTRDNQLWVAPESPRTIPFFNLLTGQSQRLRFIVDESHSGTLDF